MFAELKHILSKYDDPDRKGFEYYEVASDIGSLPQEMIRTDEGLAELWAFYFQENGGYDEWGTYYGSHMSGTRTDKETGEVTPAYYPDYRDLTKKHFDHWLARAKKTGNPLMRMRYLGLVYDLQKKAIGVEPGYKDVKLPYVESVIESVVGQFYHYEFCGLTYAKRALQCATALHNNELIMRAKYALLAVNKHCKDKDDKPWVLKKCLLISLEYRAAFTDEEIQQLVKETEGCFARFEKLAMQEECRTDSHAHQMKELTEALSEYYNKEGRYEKVEDLLDRVCAAIRMAKEARGAMWLHGMLREMQALYRKYHLNKKANLLYVDIQKTSKEAMREMQPFSVPITLKNELVEDFLEEALQGTNEEVLERYIVKYIPWLKIERKHQDEEQKHGSFLDTISTTTYDAMGNPINYVGAGEDAEHQKFVYGMCNRMQMSSVFMRMIVQKMKEKEIFTYESVIDTFESSIVLNEDQKPIFERGIEAYFEEDYLVASHLLIPQFESAIRMLVARLGGEILQHDQNPVEGNRYISLDGLLDSDVMKATFPEDILVYYKNLFTDHNGWNLRNTSCHGLLKADSYNSTMADRIVHAFMVLSQVKVRLPEEG